MSEKIRLRLKRLRVSRGFTYYSLSEATGDLVSPFAIQMFETGEWDMDNTKFALVLDALGVTLEEFFTDDQPAYN